MRQRLRRSKLSLDGVQFVVKDGTVTWNGAVSVVQRKGAATRLAKSAGARRVINQLRTPHNAKTAAPKPSPREVRVGAIPPKAH